MAAGRTAKGRIKKGYKLTKGGRVVKAGGTRKRKRTVKRRRNPPAAAAPKRRRRKRRATSTPTRRYTVAKRKRRSPARKRRRTYRRNVPQLRGITGTITKGATGAFQVLAGKAIARVLPEQLGIPTAGTTGIAAQAGIALLVGMFGKQLFGAKAGEMLLVGALTAPVESIVVAANVPVLSPALSAYPSLSYGMSAYPKALPPVASDVALGAYGAEEYTGIQYGQ